MIVRAVFCAKRCFLASISLYNAISVAAFTIGLAKPADVGIADKFGPVCVLSSVSGEDVMLSFNVTSCSDEEEAFLILSNATSEPTAVTKAKRPMGTRKRGNMLFSNCLY